MDTAILIKTLNADGKDGKKPSLIIENVGDVMPIKINLKPLNKTQSFVFSIISFWMYKF